MEKIALYLQRRFKCRLKTILLVLLMVVVALALPKMLKPREKDKVVFKEIGEVIAQQEGNNNEIKIAAPMDILRWISFYANLDYPGSPCPQPYKSFYPLVGDGYEPCMTNLKEEGMQYLVWTEKRWPGDSALFLKKAEEGGLPEMGSWHHPDTGRIILLKLP